MSGNQAEVQMKHDENSFKNSRGQNIVYRRVIPQGKDIEGILLFIHGIGEHQGRYDELLERFAKDLNFAVYSHDQMGHGKSEGLRVHCEEFEEFVDDGNQMTELMKKEMKDVVPEETLPLFLCGISFGGLVASHIALSKVHKWDGLILSAAAMGVEMTPVMKVQSKIGGLLNALVPKAKLVKAVREEDMTKDPAVTKSYKEDPLVIDGNTRVRIGWKIAKAMDRAQENASSLTIPVLGIHGDIDKCTSPAMSAQFVSNTSSKDKTFKKFKNVKHMVYHEPEKEEVIKYVEDWMNTRAHPASNQADA